MRNVDDLRVRLDAENDAFHGGYEVIGQAEVGCQGDDWSRHTESVGRAYFDHNATTPLNPDVIRAMAASLETCFGNASSIHREGQAARQAVEAARRDVAQAVGVKPEEVVFTSGGTESNNLAIIGLQPRHVITTVIEHPAVLNVCQELERRGTPVTWIRVSSAGVIDPDDVRRAIRPDTDLISIMAVNNELGTIQPVEELLSLGVALHSDCVQAFGKIPLPPASLMTLSAHKIYGPKGAGALIVRKGTSLRKVTFGGRHERDRRPGTENVPAIVGFGAAVRRLPSGLSRIAALRDRLEQGILERVPHAAVNGAGAPRVANTTNIRFDGIEGEAMVIALDLRGFAVSSGAACSSGAVEPSHVLRALGLTKEQARSSIRFSLGESNTAEEVDALIDAVAASAARLRKLSPAYA
jgi:cysteine desulfurase